MSVTDAYPTPLADGELAATWAAAWSTLARPAPAGLQAELMTAWSEPHRHYHDQRHLRECLALWTRWREHSPRAGEVALALWFHDAIYDPQAGSNELNSAAWAARSLVRAGADSDTAQPVQDLVMVTQHGFTQEMAPAVLDSSPDAQLLVDITRSCTRCAVSLSAPARRRDRAAHAALCSSLLPARGS